MKNVFCKILGHNWKYNFSTLPSKCICVRCGNKAKLNLHTLEWEPVLYFDNETRTDAELKSQWVSNKVY